MKPGLRSKLLWYIHRLRSMNVPEVMYRFQELGHKTAGRLKRHSWSDFQSDCARPAVHIAEMFSADRLSDSIRPIISDEAEKARSGRFELLGQVWPLPSIWPPPPAFWHAAPGEELVPDSALAFCFEALSRSSAEGRDLKRVWEVNRLQFIVPLAVEASLTENPQDRDLVYRIIFAWMDANPPYAGISYASGIELAIRVISVALALSILGEAHLPQDEKDRLGAFFVAHDVWLARFPSLYSSENNHRIAELAGQVVCAVILQKPQMKAEHLLNELSICLMKQIHADGVGAEQAPTYTAFSVELSLIAFAFAKMHSSACKPDVIERLKRWNIHIQWLMDAAARVPEIGDNDAGRGIMMTQAQEPRYVASVVAMLAAWLFGPELAPPDREPHLRDCLFGSVCSPGIVTAGFKTWPEGGYSIFRGDKASYVLAFDHGPVGHLSIAAHGHADTLAVWLTVGETPVLIDAGTATYRPQDALRDRLRHTAVHNTLTVDEEPSSAMAGPFNWSSKANGRLVNRQPGSIAAGHDGYVKRYGIEHRRRVDLVSPDTIQIVDCLEGSADQSYPVLSRFLLGPDCLSQPSGDGQWLISHGGRPIATISFKGPLNSLFISRASVDAGKWTTSYGKINDAAMLCSKGRLAVGEKQLTTIRLHVSHSTNPVP